MRTKAQSRSLLLSGPKTNKHRSSTGPSAIGKVLELIADLMVQIDRDANSDGKSYEEYTTWYHNTSMNAKRVVDETSQNIDALKAGLEEQEAFRDGARRDLTEAGNKRAAVEKDLEETDATRKKERKEFEKSEATLVEGVDQLERSLVVLGKQLGSAPSSASLLSVAENLRKTLESSKDFDLSAGQRQTLHAFLRAANVRSHKQDEPADFLQVEQDRQPEQYGEFESQSGSVVETLQSVLDKTKAALEEARSKETKAMEDHKSLDESLKAEIKNLKKTMAELNTQLSQSQEQSGQMQSQLIAASELLTVSQDQLKEIEAEHKEKARNYHSRTEKRTDELMALTEAKEILGSAAMDAVMDGGESGSSALQRKASRRSDGDAASADSFLQIQSPERARGDRLAKRAAELASQARAIDAAPALSFVALRHFQADPFEKVRDMIQGMLAKLQDQQNEEAKHKEWCDREMSKSVQSKKEKQDDIRKLTDRIAAMDAELAQIADNVKVVTEDLDEMSTSIKSATKIREDERNSAITALTQSKDAQELIKAAIRVLKRVYKEADKAEEGSAPAPKEEGREANPNDGDRTYGWGTGVVGILEVALQDYADIESEVTLQETTSEKEYKEMMDQSEIRQATFGKDLEYKQRAKVKLEGDRMRSSTDLKGYTKELEAVDTYLKELQSSCVAKPDSYEERAARRESELKSLKEALDFLNGEGMA